MSIVIVGAGGHGREVLDVVDACGLPFEGFVDDGSPDPEPLVRRRAVLLGGLGYLTGHSGSVLVGIGDGSTRAQVAAALEGSITWSAAVVHPFASVGSDVGLGEGTVLAAGARLTTHIAVGRHSYVGPNATIGHDTVIGDFVTVLPGATVSGGVQLGSGTTVGTGANIRQGIVVGAGAMIGAGGVVVDDVPEGVTVIGVPARPR